METSRDRPKSAPYLGLKNGEKTKVSQLRKKLKEGTPFSLARNCMLRGKKEKIFLVQFPESTILVTSGATKKNTKEKP